MKLLTQEEFEKLSVPEKMAELERMLEGIDGMIAEHTPPVKPKFELIQGGSDEL